MYKYRGEDSVEVYNQLLAAEAALGEAQKLVDKLRANYKRPRREEMDKEQGRMFT